MSANELVQQARRLLDAGTPEPDILRAMGQRTRGLRDVGADSGRAASVLAAEFSQSAETDFETYARAVVERARRLLGGGFASAATVTAKAVGGPVPALPGEDFAGYKARVGVRR